MKKLWFVAICAVVTMACEAEPMRRSESANRGVSVNVLTEFDGIRLYRVQDGSQNFVYVAVSGSEIRTQWQQRQGKTTVRRETVTVQR